jgi:hypothetical protein
MKSVISLDDQVSRDTVYNVAALVQLEGMLPCGDPRRSRDCLAFQTRALGNGKLGQK